MTVLSPPTINTNRFSWHSAEKLFIAEASDLQLNLGRVYDDACDIGFSLESARTGDTLVCAETAHERDGEGDLLWTEFTPLNARGYPTPELFTVRIVND